MADTANHYSEGKQGVDQIPPEILLEVGEIYSYGQNKYGRDNWKGGMPWDEIYGSALRHIYKFWAGEDFDVCPSDEANAKCTGSAADYCPVHSRKSHLVQAIWNIIALRYYQLKGLGTDTRDCNKSTITVTTPFWDMSRQGAGVVVGGFKPTPIPLDNTIFGGVDSSNKGS